MHPYRTLPESEFNSFHESNSYEFDIAADLNSLSTFRIYNTLSAIIDLVSSKGAEISHLYIKKGKLIVLTNKFNSSSNNHYKVSYDMPTEGLMFPAAPKNYEWVLNVPFRMHQNNKTLVGRTNFYVQKG